MNPSSSTSPSGSATRDGVARGLAGIREVLDELRHPSDRRPAARPERADVREAVLLVLAEGPADGYRIVRLLEERGAGERTPGAGAVYPMLQLLADEGLASPSDDDGRKVWTLTTAGRSAADAARTRPGESQPTGSHGSTRRGSIVRSGAQLGQVVALAAQTVRPDQVGEVVAVLDETRRRILAVLTRS